MTTQRLDAVAELVKKGIIRVHVDQIFSVENAKEAFLARESGKVRGKVVLSFR